ncbi:sigma-70 family RNA polymerase sigma factor [Euzebya sp.]|uniref:sigma-70 family RNA polymerase sigma factor n=1 Tax=Euzebya sp. TaxID=1971409 RepID=UPI003514F47A
MQSSRALDQPPRPPSVRARLSVRAQTSLAAIASLCTLRVAVATAGGRGLPVHLAAAAYRGAAAPVTARAPGGDAAAPDAAELIDADVIAHVRDAQDGNAHAFSLLYDRYVDRVYGYCYHRVGNAQTAEDLTADVFMRALKRIDSFSWQGKDFGAWLIAIARNRCHDHFKSARFRMENPVAEVYDSPDSGPSYDARPERDLELRELQAQVHAALEQLKSEHAEVLFHRFLQGFDVEATARVMGKKPGAIRALQYRALKALAKHVDVEAFL